MTTGMLVVGFSPNAFRVIELDDCEPVMITALIYAVASSIEIDGDGMIWISLVTVTPVTVTVYV